MSRNCRAVLFSTRFIGEYDNEKNERKEYMFKESTATPFQSKELCNYFRTRDVYQFIYQNDNYVKEELLQLRNSFKEEMQELGFSWKLEYEERTEKSIIKELQNTGTEMDIISKLSSFFYSKMKIINDSFIDRFEKNPSLIISNVISKVGDKELPLMNIGSTKGTFAHRFQLYELPQNGDSQYSVYSVWDLKSRCSDGSWEKALCEEIIQRGQKDHMTYSDIYLILHDKDLFDVSTTFGVKEPYPYVGDPSITIHVAFFQHDTPDPIFFLLKKVGLSTEDVAKCVINLVD